MIIGFLIMFKNYNGALTAEQFLFFETRIVARKILKGEILDEIISSVIEDNLFQFPTEREVSRMVRACYKRIISLDNNGLVYELANAPIETAKQINLYAIMRYNVLVYEFMTELVGEKFKQQDFTFTKKDINSFFSTLREQNDSMAAWSDKTIAKLKQVLTKCLIEVEILNDYRSTTLNPVFISFELENGIRENNDLRALIAFNCFN